jgi:hypothetical protein
VNASVSIIKNNLFGIPFIPMIVKSDRELLEFSDNAVVAYEETCLEKRGRFLNESEWKINCKKTLIKTTGDVTATQKYLVEGFPLCVAPECCRSSLEKSTMEILFQDNATDLKIIKAGSDVEWNCTWIPGSKAIITGCSTLALFVGCSIIYASHVCPI